MANITVTPPVYDRTDPDKTLRQLCEYNAKLQEELQWCLTQLEKKIKK